MKYGKKMPMKWVNPTVILLEKTNTTTYYHGELGKIMKREMRNTLVD
jgi:hypothetical protein